jgi:hypothetical protein
MKKDTQDLLFKVGVAVGVYFFVVKPLLEKLGIAKTPEQNQYEEDQKKAQVDPLNAFSPTFWKTVKSASLLTVAQARQFAKVIHDAINGSLVQGDDVNRVIGIFRKLKAKTQLSWLAYQYGLLYKNADLLYDLEHGSNAFYLNNPRAGLNQQEMQTIFDIVKNLK